jgi:hypothetical protein
LLQGDQKFRRLSASGELGAEMLTAKQNPARSIQQKINTVKIWTGKEFGRDFL